MQAHQALATLFLAFGASGCVLFDRATVGVDRPGPEAVDAQLNEHALTGNIPSSSSREVLHYFDLSERFDEDPDAALVELYRGVAAAPERRFLHALAELSYLRGKDVGSREHFLAAAVYAYLYLLGEPGLPPANPYDRTFRWACDLYNRGLRDALVGPEDDGLRVQPGTRKLPIGSLELSVDRSALPFEQLIDLFQPADDYSVWGLSLRLRDSGLGVPVIAKIPIRDAADPMARFHQRSNTYSPVTVFLRVEGGLADLEVGLTGKLELYSTFDSRTVAVGDRNVPLESDFSTTLAVALHRSSLWKLSSSGFFGSEATAKERGLFIGRPYKPGLVPVVFVHGTASNPANWAEMFNLLQADPEIRGRMQFWFFRYPTGLPVAVSAATLRDELKALVETLDPEGRDPALRRMVLVGHSQGGLLVKLMVVDGDVGWWQDITGSPLEGFGLPKEQEDLVRHVLDFDPLPFVNNVVFISTPHRGSFLADRWFSRFINKLVAIPGELTDLNSSLEGSTKLPKELRGRVPTSLDNMKASNPFLRRLARAPIASGVGVHSIIPIGDADPNAYEDADDGVVEYKSAHLDGIDSELRIRSGHSCQDNPHAIREVRRILLEQLRGSP